MDELLPQLLTFPPHPPPSKPLSDGEYDSQIRQFVQNLSKVGAHRLLGTIADGGDLLDMLDPSINTIPYLFTLLANIAANASVISHSSFSVSKVLWTKMLDFMDKFDPVQIRYVGHDFVRLIEWVERAGDLEMNPVVSIPPIRTAMLRLDPTTSCFTSTHHLFAKLCLRNKAFSPALPILDNNIYHFPTASERSLHLPLPCCQHDTSSTYITISSGLTHALVYGDHLRYFLYGAMIYMGLKKWDEALLFLEIVIVSPASVTSMIQVEAYKKWVLVGLLLTGGPMPMPQNINQTTSKQIRAISKPYEVLAKTFQEGDSSSLYAEAQAGQEIWQQDNNFGLVKQVTSAYRRFAILKLSKTYAALSIPVLATRIGSTSASVAETESYVNSLIASGELNATLIPSADPAKPPILRFAASIREGPLGRSETAQHVALERHSLNIRDLSSHAKATERKLELTKEHLEWARRAKKAKENGELAPGSLPVDTGSSFTFAADEDMLADM